MARAKAVKHIRHNLTLPPIAQAANLALIIMGAAKVSTWKDLVNHPENRAHLRLTPEQQQLLDDHADLLDSLCRTPLRTIYTCPTCGRFAYIDKAASPTRCNLTLGCSGTPVKATTTAGRLPTAETASAGDRNHIEPRT